MKNIIKILIVIFVFIANQINAQNNIYIKYDVAYVDKYQYKVENLSSQDFHIAYHIYTSMTERIILNIAMSSYQNTSSAIAKNAVSLTQIDWDATLINEINNGLKKLYLVFNEEDSYQTYQISTAIFVEETNSKLMYSGPYYSYTFDKNKEYGVAEDLELGVYTIYDESVFMTNNGNSMMNCLNQYSFIKIIKETHPKGSFTMIANEDFSSLHKDEVLETCQSALYVDFIENIGVIEERTKNGKITLIGINDKPLQKYIEEKCQTSSDIPAEYSFTTSSNTESVQPGLTFTTRGDENTEKSGTTTNNGANTIVMNPSPNVTTKTNNTTATYGEEGEYELVFEMVGNGNRTVAENTQKSATPTNGKTHIVDNGETLYSISKKYGMTVKVLQELNNLETPDIFVTQVLIITENIQIEY